MDCIRICKGVRTKGGGKGVAGMKCLHFFYNIVISCVHVARSME